MRLEVRAARRRPRAGPRIADPALDELLRRMLEEDRVGDDRTTRGIFPAPVPGRAVLIAERAGVVSGVAAAARLATLAGLRVRARRSDGDPVRRGTEVLELTGDVRRLLAVERSALNLLMHLSGIATAARRAVRAGGPLAVLGTRKTVPGLRRLGKAALRDGGAGPHRLDLSDALLLKSPHLALVPVDEAVARLRRRYGPRATIEVEVRSLPEARAALAAGARSLLLDNAGPRRARAIVRALRADPAGRSAHIELSGGLSIASLPRYRGSGADAASLGELTHSAPALPFHLRLRPPSRPGRRPPARSPARRR